MKPDDSLYKTLRIQAVTETIKNFKIFSFAENISYKAGQYLTLVYQSSHEEIRRSYSIISSPVLNEPLSIGVKRIENGFFSRRLVDTALVNDEVITIGSGGLFVLPDDMNDYAQVFFFAAGSGVTPIYSLIKTLLYAHTNIDVVLIYSNTSPDTSAFLNELSMLQRMFAQRFHIEFLFSNIVELSKARLHRNLLLDFLNKYARVKYDACLFYICGPESYMRLCIYTLQENDVPKNNIKHEDFVINAVRKRDALPPDKTAHKINLHLNKIQFYYTAHYPDSILQAAKKQNITLPYSCEAGRCGSCVARCLTGNVWHSYNEVLTEKELRQGLILTCVGYAVNGDVELEIKTNNY